MPKLTTHAKIRMKQRSGITTKNQKKLNKRIYERGIKYLETQGKLRNHLKNVVKKDSKYVDIRIYGNNIYVFKNETLITVLDLPYEYASNLQQFVKPEIYFRYIMKRNKRQNKKLDEIFEKVIHNFVTLNKDKYPYDEMLFEFDKYYSRITITYKSKGTLTGEMRTEISHYFNKFCNAAIIFKQNKKLEKSDSLRIRII